MVALACIVAKQHPIAPRRVKWVCTVAMEAAAAIPQRASAYLSTPVHVANELLQTLLHGRAGDGVWRPNAEGAIQLVASLPQGVRGWLPDRAEYGPHAATYEADLAAARELRFWCEWVYGWDMALRCETSSARSSALAGVANPVLQHALVEGLPADALEAQALGAVRHLVEALRCLPPQERLAGDKADLLRLLVPVTTHPHARLFPPQPHTQGPRTAVPPLPPDTWRPSSSPAPPPGDPPQGALPALRGTQE